MMGSREQAMNQPFPDQGTVSYDPIDTSTTAGSGTRFATTPMSVQRGELADPTAGASRSAERTAALEQDLPRKAKTVPADTDSLAIATVRSKAGWSTQNAPVVMLRQGLYSKRLATIARNDNDIEIANLIARLEDEYEADAVFVDAGYGTGIVSAGTVMGRSWQLVWFGSTKVPDPGYCNMRAYIWGQMKRWLKAGGSIYDLSRHLGHTSVKTTEIYLGHLTGDEQHRARGGHDAPAAPREIA